MPRQLLVVLINEGSASASEVLSGAVRDNEIGTLVGEKTFGKALVQTVTVYDIFDNINDSVTWQIRDLDYIIT